MTASAILDFNTVATADKFGNVSVVSRTLLLSKVGGANIAHTSTDQVTTRHIR